MKIAFASCMSTDQYPEQSIWDDVRAHAPKVLVLLGDSIYMDYFPHLERPAGYSPEKFAQTMHGYYQAQYHEPSFKKLVLSVDKVYTTWDDHDFGWNDAYGTDKRFNDGKL